MCHSVRQDTDSVWFMVEKPYNSCNAKNHNIKYLMCYSVSNIPHFCPLQVLNISNGHAHLAYNCHGPAGVPWPATRCFFCLFEHMACCLLLVPCAPPSIV